jgi:hypothetical protein
LQAGNAYAMSPCDETMKSNLIAAVTAYTRAWQEKMDCPRPQNMLMFCSDKKIKEVADTFRRRSTFASRPLSTKLSSNAASSRPIFRPICVSTY